jgi:hypothetical protein
MLGTRNPWRMRLQPALMQAKIYASQKARWIEWPVKLTQDRE